MFLFIYYCFVRCITIDTFGCYFQCHSELVFNLEINNDKLKRRLNGTLFLI